MSFSGMEDTADARRERLFKEICPDCHFYKSDMYSEPCESCIAKYINNLCPYFFKHKEIIPNTNYERIKAMTIEEMAEFINKNYKCRKCAYYNKCCDSNCESGIKLWLESEVSDE